MDFGYNAEQEKLRREVREFLAKELTPAVRAEMEENNEGRPLHRSACETPLLKQLFQKIADRGWVGISYPKEYGGHGHKGFQMIASQEMGRAGVPFMINVIGLGMAAPTILVHGTEEQKRRFLPPLLSADEIWCQGFSEPGAGSDLANAQTTAVRQGDNWIMNGHKVWTSLAHFASWMILLCRSSREDKYKGLTYFIAPIAGAKGVTVRPLVKPALVGPTWQEPGAAAS